MKRKIGMGILFFLILTGWTKQYCYANEEKNDEKEYIEYIVNELDLEDADKMTDKITEQKISFSDMVGQLMGNGIEQDEMKDMGEYIKDVFYKEFADVKPLFIEIIILLISFSLLNQLFANREKYISSMSFFVVYGMLMILLMQSFVLLSDIVCQGIDMVISFLTVIIPVFASSLIISGDMASAGVFYELSFGTIYILEWAMRTFLVPGIHIFVLLEFLNHLMEEEKFSKLADLMESCICGFLKITFAGVIGFGGIQSLLTPAKDKVSENMILKSLSAIPGVGNSIGATGELVFSCGMLIKNSVGVAALIFLVFICLVPVIKVLLISFSYRFTAAILQPIGDRRLIQCINGVARGAKMYWKILIHTLLLFFIIITMITAASSFG